MRRIVVTAVSMLIICVFAVQAGAETKKDFYAELPIKIRLSGSYHEFGQFVSGIAALPRTTHVEVI